MCGIVAYIGNRQVVPLLIKGLKRLEYRGYDSAGIAVLDHGIQVCKTKGKVSGLEELIYNQSYNATCGIAHTRWATHGEPNIVNAHPHSSGDGKLSLVHNGIIENYSQLHTELLRAGHQFKGETDSEVLVHFIEEIKKQNQCSTEEALRTALKRVVGAYVIVLIDEENPDRLIAARKGSPLVIGVGEGEHFLASDASPIIEYTKNVVYVNDYEIALVSRDELILKNISNEKVTPYIEQLDLNLAAIEKGGYDHFMLKEIFEQPDTIQDSFRGRIDTSTAQVTLGGIRKHLSTLAEAKRIIFVACGTSWHSALVAEYVIEELCRIPVEVEYASEFRYRNPIVGPGDVLIAISQSGETADTLVAMEMARQRGAVVLGICNVVGSSMARNTDEGIYTHAGPEIGVASTKAFTAQLVVLYLMALRIADIKRSADAEKLKTITQSLLQLPDQVRQVLAKSEDIRRVAEKYADANDFLFLGRGYNFPVALEGALKLKEISYIHAEGYPAAEMKHGPIALVDENLPVVFLATRDEYYDKIVSNIQEIKARKGKVIALVSEGDALVSAMADEVIALPGTHEMVMPVLNAVALQLLAYYTGVSKDLDVDKPRNLAKSVTVE